MSGDDLDFYSHNNKISGKPASEYIMELREYDIPYYLRVAIDNGASQNQF